MTSEKQTIDLIVEYGISVRQIPLVVVSRWGGVYDNYSLKDNEKLIEINGRVYLEKKEYPTDGGKWMAQQVGHTDRMVSWNKKLHHLSDTLDEAVTKLVEAIKSKS